MQRQLGSTLKLAFMTEVFGQFSIQCLIDKQYGQQSEQAVLAYEVFGFVVIGQQAREQFFRYFVFLGHGVFGQADFRPR